MPAQVTDSSRDGEASRRSFLNGFLGAALATLSGVVFYPVLRFLSPPRIPEAATNRVLAGTVGELAQAKWKIFAFGSEPGILIQTASGEFRAFSATCTHLSCTVQFDAGTKRIWCACHNGWFDLEGLNVAGPPPRPLARFVTNVVGSEIFVTRS